MLSQASRVSTRISRCPSTLLNQHFNHTRMTSTQAAKKKSQKAEVRTAHIRTWSPPNNISEVYSLLRSLERQYGKILDVRFLKDYEDSSKYQMVAWVLFEDAKSLTRIPSDGAQFVIQLEKNLLPTHEISMEDIETLSQSQGIDEGFKPPIFQPKDKIPVIGGRIIRAGYDMQSLQGSQLAIYQATPRPVMSSFLRWGGFQPLDPIPEGRTIKERELFSSTDLDSACMRASLQLTSDILGVPNPNYGGKKLSQASTESPSLSELVFGDGNDSPNGNSRTPITVNSSTSLPRSQSDIPQSPPPQPTTTKPTAAQPSADSPPPPPSPSPREKDSATVAAELESQEALKRQLAFARQLKHQTTLTTPRRKQPKPLLKAPRPKFFEGDYVPPATEEVKPSGVIDRLWSMFRK